MIQSKEKRVPVIGEAQILCSSRFSQECRQTRDQVTVQVEASFLNGNS